MKAVWATGCIALARGDNIWSIAKPFYSAQIQKAQLGQITAIELKPHSPLVYAPTYPSTDFIRHSGSICSIACKDEADKPDSAGEAVVSKDPSRGPSIGKIPLFQDVFMPFMR